MRIVHIAAPVARPVEEFAKRSTPPSVGRDPSPQLATRAEFEDEAVSTGVWEASPEVFARAVVDAEFSHFIAGRATFVTTDGQRFEFRAGDAAYFPPYTKGIWTVHETLRKTFCVWR